MSWRDQALELLNSVAEEQIRMEDLEEIELPNFSTHLSVGEAIKDEDPVQLASILVGLENTEDAEWRGSEFEQELNRIMGTEFDSELDEQDNPFAAARQNMQGRGVGAQPQQPEPPQQPQQPQQPPTASTEPEQPEDPFADAELGIEDMRPGQEMEIDGRQASVVRTMPTRGTAEVKFKEEGGKRSVVRVRETTSAGAIATAAQPMGRMIKREPEKPKPKTSRHAENRRRKK